MLTSALLLFTASLLCWPDVRARRRLRPSRRSMPVTREQVAGIARVGVLPLAGGIGGVCAGLGGLCAASVLAALGTWYFRFRRDSQARLARAAGLARGLRLLVAELHAGSHPVAAADGVAADAPTDIAEVFRRMSAAARLGGDIGSAVGSAVNGQHGGLGQHDGLGQPLRRIARAWELAERHGVALADLLDSVRRDVEHRLAFARETEAKMAGPRATAAVIAGLPVLGLALGEASGSAPLAVLTGQPFGQALLVVGVCLLGAGVLWTVRLTESVVRL